MRYKTFIIIFIFLMFLSCVKSREFDTLQTDCSQNISANSTFNEVKNLYVDETFQIQQDLIIEGYINSSDKEGNFFNVLHFQNKPVNPTEGFQIEIDLRDSHLFYPEGNKIAIKLKGLYLGKSKDIFKLGGTFTSFGNISVGRLPASILNQHIFISCDDNVALKPTEVTFEELNNSLTNTLVTFTDVQILDNELGETFAQPQEETERTLINCNTTTLTLVNSGFSDFQSVALPEKNGTITGVLLRDKTKFKLAIRHLSDIEFTQVRCEEENEMSSNKIFISEIADPENNAEARFVELYNASSIAIPLKGWTFIRYTNDSETISATIDLTEQRIEPMSTLVISPNSEVFKTVYGFSPNLEAGGNSPANSNGDDNLVLVDPFGKVIDIFGVIGEDGTGTNHDFQNGRALRKIEVINANATYNANEWKIYNNNGGGGNTILQPQIAPKDFTPSVRG